VKSVYSSLLNGVSAADVLEGEILQAISQVWKSWAPSKLVIFSWQLLLDRISTGFNLVRRGISLPVEGLGCVFCEPSFESSEHLFLSCPFILSVWYQVAR